MKWFEELKQFKFKIKQIKKSNNKQINILSQRFDYMEQKKYLQQMLKMNQNGSLSFNFKKLKLTTKFLKNKEKEFPISINKIHILQEKIKKYIQEYHNPLKFGHLRISNTIDIIKRNCHFDNMKKHV